MVKRICIPVLYIHTVGGSAALSTMPLYALVSFHNLLSLEPKTLSKNITNIKLLKMLLGELKWSIYFL